MLMRKFKIRMKYKMKLIDDLVEFICDVSIITFAVLTLPIWIVPYLIYKWW